ncbi:riboflavin synthase [Geomicrobium halophilum]|nr:riboflavin synthase [Geomicrobium halophilum]
MFTGLIEEVGIVEDMAQTGNKGRITIQCSHVLEDANIGDSIAVNGVCLTVTSVDKRQFTADVMAETIKSTALSQLRKNQQVNLERAMAASDRFGGHIVSGHIDGIGEIIRHTEGSEATYFQIQTSHELLRYIVKKGSVAVDGISLTVADVDTKSFTIALIPHTLRATNLGVKSKGDAVNIECDIIGKYVEKLLKPKEEPDATMSDLLERNGFV